MLVGTAAAALGLLFDVEAMSEHPLALSNARQLGRSGLHGRMRESIVVSWTVALAHEGAYELRPERRRPR